MFVHICKQVESKPKKGFDIPKAKNWLLTREEIREKYGKYGVEPPRLLIYSTNIEKLYFHRNYTFNWNFNEILQKQLKIKSKRKMIIDELTQKGMIYIVYKMSLLI